MWIWKQSQQSRQPPAVLLDVDRWRHPISHWYPGGCSITQTGSSKDCCFLQTYYLSTVLLLVDISRIVVYSSATPGFFTGTPGSMSMIMKRIVEKSLDIRTVWWVCSGLAGLKTQHRTSTFLRAARARFCDPHLSCLLYGLQKWRASQLIDTKLALFAMPPVAYTCYGSLLVMIMNTLRIRKDGRNGREYGQIHVFVCFIFLFSGIRRSPASNLSRAANQHHCKRWLWYIAIEDTHGMEFGHDSISITVR